MEFFDSMNMVEHEAVVGEEETIPAYSELIPPTGELYSPMNIDFYPQVQPTSPFFDRPLSPLWNFQDNNYDFSARGDHSIITTDVRIHHDRTHGTLATTIVQRAFDDCSKLAKLTSLPIDTLPVLVSTLEKIATGELAIQICNALVEVASGTPSNNALSVWNFLVNNDDFSARGGPSILSFDVRHLHTELHLLFDINVTRLEDLVHLKILVYFKYANQVSYDSETSDLCRKFKKPMLIKRICNAPLEVASGKVLEEAISVKITKFSGDNKLDSNHESPQGPQDYPNGGDMVQIDSSVQQPAVEFDVRHNGGNIVIMGESDTPVAGSERKNAKKISKRKHRNTETLLSPELLQQQKGRMTLDEIAECTGASRSSLKRFCRKHEIPRWPRKKNESVQGVEGAPSQPSLAKDLLNDGIGRPAKLNKSNQQKLSLAFRQTELNPSAPYCVSNTLASMQPQISAERMLTEVPGCPEYLKFLDHSKKGKGVLESNETVRSCSNPTHEHTVASVAPTMPQVIAMHDVSTMTIKVRYRSEIFRFPLSFSSGKRELEENILKRLELKLGTFRIKYQDADGDWISIACDEDLQHCMGDLKRLGNSTIIMSVKS